MEDKNWNNSLLLLCEAIPVVDVEDHSPDKNNNNSNSEKLLDAEQVSPTQLQQRSRHVHKRAKIDVDQKKIARKSKSLDLRHIPSVDVIRAQSTTSWPCYLFAAFNIGDMDLVTDLVDAFTTEDVLLDTNALPNPVHGRIHVTALFQSLIDGHPDAYLVATESSCSSSSSTNADHVSTVTTKFQFKGTKALPSNNEFYFFKPTLVDNMALFKYTEEDIARLRDLEAVLVARNKPIEVEFRGALILTIQDKTIVAMRFDCALDSFSEAKDNIPNDAPVSNNNNTGFI